MILAKFFITDYGLISEVDAKSLKSAIFSFVDYGLIPEADAKS